MSEKLKEYIDQYFGQGVFLPTKTLRLTGSVDEDMYIAALCGLDSLDSVTGQITIKLMSDGGDVNVARGIYDLIRGCQNHVRIVCYGEVASAATIILQAADQRIMTPSSKIMIHAGSEGIPSDHPRNVDKVYKNYRDDEEWMINVYLEKIREKKKRFTRQKLEDELIWDNYMKPKVALEYGLIDEIKER